MGQGLVVREHAGRMTLRLLRLPLLIIHIVFATPITVATFNRLGRRIRIGQQALDVFMLRWWSGTLCRLMGLKLKVKGELADGPVLIAANHLSWLDIQLLHSRGKMSFVAKAEIRGWPLMGWLAKMGGSIFHNRGSDRSLQGVMEDMNQVLGKAQRVAIFPEGGVLPGNFVKRFHARMFGAAQRSGCPVQPVCVRYIREGAINGAMSIRQGESIGANLFRVLGQPSGEVELHFLEPFLCGDMDRRSLAQKAQQMVMKAYDSQA